MCRQLMEMEPDSKWPVVTLARLCHATGSAAGRRESKGSFRRLATLDPMRAGYYCDCCR
jgi:geranylgeranyl transferase type-2 subunit alpha